MSTTEAEVAGTLALVGGGEWRAGTRDLDAAAAGSQWRHRGPRPADRGGLRARRPGRGRWRARTSPSSARGPQPPGPAPHARPRAADIAETVRDARFVYFADGSPLHLRSVLKGSALFDALLAAYRSGAVLAASGRRCHRAVRSDGRPPRRRVHRRSRRGGRGRRLPVPRQRRRPPPRALDRPPPRERHPRRHRRGDRAPPPTREPRWSVVGAGRGHAVLGGESEAREPRCDRPGLP